MDLSFRGNLFSCAVTFSDRSELIFGVKEIKYGQEFFSRFYNIWEIEVEGAIKSLGGFSKVLESSVLTHLY